MRSPRSRASASSTRACDVAIEPRRRLVEQEHRQLGRERARERDPLAFAARHRPARRAELDARRNRVAQPGRHRWRRARRRRRDLSLGSHREDCPRAPRDDRRTPEASTRTAALGAHASPRQVVEPVAHAPDGRGSSPSSARSERRLAGTGRSDDGDDLSRRAPRRKYDVPESVAPRRTPMRATVSVSWCHGEARRARLGDRARAQSHGRKLLEGRERVRARARAPRARRRDRAAVGTT